MTTEASSFSPEANPPRKICTGCARGLPATLEYFTAEPKGAFNVTAKCRDCQALERHNAAMEEQQAKFDAAKNALVGHLGKRTQLPAIVDIAAMMTKELGGIEEVVRMWAGVIKHHCGKNTAQAVNLLREYRLLLETAHALVPADADVESMSADSIAEEKDRLKRLEALELLTSDPDLREAVKLKLHDPKAEVA